MWIWPCFRARFCSCAAILTELNSRENLPQLTFILLGQHDFNNFCNLSRLILEKAGSAPFSHQLFFTYVQLTVMLHYRIHAFLHTQLLVRNSFQNQSEGFRLRAAMKTQRLAYI